MAHDRITAVRITGGFLDGLSIELAAGLNCVIGGTGAGKTTLLELILYGLGAEVAKSRAAGHDALVAHALGGGRVVVEVVTRHGLRYISSRAYGGPPEVRSAEGEVVPVVLAAELFPIEYRATKEVEALAGDPRAQLELIDSFVEAELRPVNAEIARLGRALAEDAKRLADLDREIADDEERAAGLAALTETLRALASPPGIDPAVARKASTEKAQRARERAFLDAQIELVAQRKKRVDELARERGANAFRLPSELASSPNADLFAALGVELAAAEAADIAALGRVAGGVESARATLARQSLELAARHERADAEHRSLLADADREKGAAAERAQLEKRLTDVSKVAHRLDASKAARAELAKAREATLSALARQRDAKRSLRDRAVREINRGLDGRVKVSRKPDADRSAFQELMASLTAGANIRPATFLQAVVRELRPDQLAACVAADDIEPLVAADPSKTNKEDRARLLLRTLRASGRAHELDTAVIEDLPIIELATEKGFSPTSELSTGERCTAMLTVLLQRRRGPLVIDEPEQHLHNRFIYSVLVKLLAEAQGAGQLLFATHNANIVVLGDAQRVFALEAGGGHGRVAEAGTVEELSSAIVILEGGREALKRRVKKYRAPSSESDK